MAHLGRADYALLLHLSDSGPQPVAAEGNRAKVGDEQFRTAVIDNLAGLGWVKREAGDDGVEHLELSDAGRTGLAGALAQKWVVDHSGLHEESRTYRFEVSDPVTGRRFVVAVSQDTDAQLANRVAYGVIGAPSVRETCRKLETIGPEGAFPVQMALEGVGEIKVWRKL